MKSGSKAGALTLLSLVGGAGLAFASDGMPAVDASNSTSSATSVTVDEKTLKKLSMGIGEEISSFAVVKAQAVDSPAGYKGMEYTIRTNGGTTFKCEVLEQSKFGRIVTLGTGKGTSAMCTQFSSGGSGTGAKDTTGRTAGGSSINAPDIHRNGAASSSSLAVDDKTLKNISTAIGEEVGDFAVIKQEKVESPAGYNGMQYTVVSNGGRKFKCEILEPSKFGRIITFGTGNATSAMCTNFTSGSEGAGQINQASCNALLRAAGKCG